MRKNKTDNLLKGIEEQGGAHCLPHGVVLIMKEVNHQKELKKKKMLDKVTRTNHEEDGFKGVEATMVEEEDLIGVLGVV